MIVFEYNEVDVFDGLSRAPLLERSEEIFYTGQNISRADVFTLSGQLKRTECNGGFDHSYELTKSLIMAFGINFKKFEILDGSNTIFSNNYTVVESINFQDSRYYDLIPFTIKLICYKDSYADAYGVLEPSETWDYQENEDQTTSITHTISCRGINTSSQALTNARAFVSTFSGYDISRDPAAVINRNSSILAIPVLLQKTERINKYSGEVSITETYIYDPTDRAGSDSSVLLYQIETDVAEGPISISISGSLTGNFDEDIETTRSVFNNISFYNIANNEYKALYDPAGNLPLYPLGFSVSEQSGKNVIEFTFNYTNDTNTDPYVVDETTITREGATHCISVSVQIKSDRGCPAERMRKTKAYFESFNIVSYIAAKWATYGTGKRIGSIPSQQAVSFDNLTGTIVVKATICSNATEDCGCLENLKYTIKCSPAIPQLSEEASYGQGAGCYAIQDLNYLSRSRFSVSGSARPSKCCSTEAVKSQIYSRVHQLLGEYFNASDIVLDSGQIEIATDKTVVSFNFSWNGAQSQALPDTYFYATF